MHNRQANNALTASDGLIYFWAIRDGQIVAFSSLYFARKLEDLCDGDLEPEHYLIIYLCTGKLTHEYFV